MINWGIYSVAQPYWVEFMESQAAHVKFWEMLCVFCKSRNLNLFLDTDSGGSEELSFMFIVFAVDCSVMDVTSVQRMESRCISRAGLSKLL